MKVLLVHNSYLEAGGEEVSVSLLQSALSGAGVSVGRYQRDSKDMLAMSWPGKLIVAGQLFFSFQTYYAVAREIRRYRPDVLHIHNLFPLVTPSVYYAARCFGVPIVHTLHNYRLACANGLLLRDGLPCEKCLGGNTFHAVAGRCYRGSRLQSVVMASNLWLHRSFRTWHRLVNSFIVLSHFSKDKLCQAGLPAEKMEIIPNFLNVRSHGFEKNRKDYFIFIGRLSSEKGILTLLQAYEIYLRGGMRRPLHILGDGPLRPDVQDFIRRHKGLPIVMHGRVDGEDKLKLLREATALVFPSQCYENCPYAVLESLAVGTPVIASRLGGIRELFNEGESGLMFTPGNPTDLSAALSDISMRPPESLARMRLEARKTAEARFDISVGLNKILSLYHKVISHGVC